MDNQNRLIVVEELAKGTIDRAAVYPREVVKSALRHDAAAVIFAHNHPSGDAEPSACDLALTLRLRQALARIDVSVLDHLIVAANRPISLAEQGRF